MIKLSPGNCPVNLKVVDRMLIITPEGKSPLALVGDDLPAVLRSLADQLVTPGKDWPGVTKLPTPLEVIEYFYRSDVLREHAADVEELLSGFIPGYNRQLIADLKQVDKSQLFEAGKPVAGIQSRIAEMLNIPNAGQSNRRRILAVLSELTGKYSTTTAKSPEIASQAA